jgi:hypothetical protein
MIFIYDLYLLFKTFVLFQMWDTNIVIDLFHDTFQVLPGNACMCNAQWESTVSTQVIEILIDYEDYLTHIWYR